MFPEAKPRKKLNQSRGNKTHCFLQELSLSVFVIPHNSKLEKTVKKSFSLHWLAHKFTAVSRSMT